MMGLHTVEVHRIKSTSVEKVARTVAEGKEYVAEGAYLRVRIPVLRNKIRRTVAFAESYHVCPFCVG